MGSGDDSPARAAGLDPDRLPAHVGIIMDGNGRWAQARNKPRTFGHNEGINTSKRIVQAASDLGLRYLSLYTFSTENWKRAEEEVGFLMGLIAGHLRNEFDFYRTNRIRIVHSGDRARLPRNVLDEIDRVVADTADFGGLTVNLAINYGGRDEIARSVRRCLAEGLSEIDEAALARHLDVPDIPDADLIIRTGGEQRLSNFLLWRGAYAELAFSDSLWPDWTVTDLIEALRFYQRRNRRFGGVP